MPARIEDLIRQTQAASGGNTSGGAPTPAAQYSPTGGNFQNWYNLVAQANQQNQQQYAPFDPRYYQQQTFGGAAQTFDGNLNRDEPFSMSGGTSGRFNGRYRDAGLADSFAIEMGKIGEFWNNLPGQIAGAFGGDNAKEDWTFDATKFDLSNGLDWNDANQAKNFVFSLPGMMIGGIFEGVNKGYEAVTGTPVQEYREKSGGGYEVADYTLDASQRAAAGLDAAINVAGTFTGGAGRVVGAVGKVAARRGLNEVSKEISRLAGTGLTRQEAFTQMTRNNPNLVESAFNKAQEELARTAHRQDILNGMSKGIVTRAVEGMTGNKGLTTGAGLLADAGDEAAEEFVQSYADDIRMKNLDEGSLDRALTGAAWGAAGGLLMGAGGRLISNRAQVNGLKEDQTPDQGVEAQTLRGNNDPLAALRNNAMDPNNLYNQKAVEAWTEQDKNNRYAVGSSVFLQTHTDSNLDFDDIELGIENLEQIFYRSEADRQKLAQAFGTDVDTLTDIFRSEEGTKADKLNSIIAMNGRGFVQVAVGRNPDTKNGGFKMNLKRVHDGQAFVTHPAVMQIVGSDWDGDRASVYLDPDLLLDDDNSEESGNTFHVKGYPSELLVDKETGNSNVEWVFAGIGKDANLKIDQIEKRLREIFSGYHKEFRNPRNPEEQINVVDYFVDEFRKAFELSDTSDRDNALSRTFADLQTTIDGLNADMANEVVRVDENNTEIYGGMMPNGKSVFKEFLKEFSDPALIQKKQYEIQANLSAKQAVAMLGVDPNTEEGAAEVENLRKEIFEWQATGTTGGSELPFQMTKSLGLLTYLANPDSKYNPIYRQYGGTGYAVRSIESIDNLFIGLAKTKGVEKVVNSILRSAFRVSKPGTDPTVAIETICDRMVVAEIRAKTGLDAQHLRTAEDIAAFRKAFIEAQSKYARIYNEAHKSITDQGFRPTVSDSYRTPLDGKGRSSEGEYFFEFDGELSQEQELSYYRNLARIISDISVGDIFHQSILNEIGVSSYLPLSDFIEYYAQYSMKGGNLDLLLTPINNDNPEMSRMIKGLVRSYQSEVTAIGMSLEKTLQSFDFKGMLGRYHKNGKNHIDPTDVPMLLKFFDFVYELIGPDNALQMGFVLNDSFVDSEIGKLLFSGDPDLMMRVITSASIYGQFQPLIEAMNSSDVITRDNAIQDLNDIAEVSPVHRRIAVSLLNGNMDVFRWFTSTDKKIDEKIAEFNFVDGIEFDKGSFIVNCLTTDTGSFAISSISSKLRKAQTAQNKSEQFKYEKMLAEVNELVEVVNDQQNNDRSITTDLEDFFYERTRRTVAAYNDDLIMLKIYASLTVSNDYIEKATIPEIIAMLYNSVEIGQNGGLLSTLNRVTASYLGDMDMNDWLGNRQQFLACASDPDYYCEVWDPQQGKKVIMTQEKLFESCGVKFEHGERVKHEHIIALLKTYPQAAGYLCEPDMNLTAVEGSITTQLARDNSILDDFNNWKNKRTTKPGQVDAETVYNTEKALRNIRSLFADSAHAQRLITLMLPDGALEGHIDPRRLSRQVSEAMDKLVSHTLWRIAIGGTDPNLGSVADADRTFNQSILEDVTADLWNLIDQATLMLTYEADENIANTMNNHIIEGVITDIVAREIEDTYGFSIDRTDRVDSIGNVTDTYKGKIKDASSRLIRIAKFLVKDQTNSLEGSWKDYARNIIDKESIRKKLIEYHGVAAENVDEIINNAIDNSRFLGINLGEQIEENDFLSEKDFDGSKSDVEIAAKVTKLLYFDREYTQEGLAGKTLKEIRAEKNEQKRNQLINNFIRKVNSQIIANELVEVSAQTGLPVNENVVQLMDQAKESYNSLIKDIETEIRTNTNLIGTITEDNIQLFNGLNDVLDEDYKVPPSFNLLSETVQSSISNQIASDPAAGNPTKVGVNGALQKNIFPLSHIPQSVTDPEYQITRTVTKADILGDNNYLEMMAQIPGMDEPVSMRSTAFRSFLNSINDDDGVIIYHPDDNPHGLPTYNMLSAAFDPKNEYHRISGIFNRIVSFTMEQMVLKTKKLMRVTDHITVKREIYSNNDKKIDGQTFDILSDHFKTYRTRFQNELSAQFAKDGELGKLGFGPDQARLVCQLLTPGVVVDVKYSDGSVSKKMIDASLLLGDEEAARARFEEYVQNTILAPDENADPEAPVPVSIESATVATATVSQVGHRIMSNIARKGVGKKAHRVERTQYAALEAVSNWNDYGDVYDGDVRTLVAKMPPVGYSYRTALPVTGNPTPRMRFEDIVSGGWFGNVTQEGTSTTNDEMKWLVPDTDLYKEAANRSRLLGLDQIQNLPPVTMVWSEGEPGPMPTKGINVQQKTILALFERDNKKFENVYGGVGVVTDRTKLPEALEWARRTNSSLLVYEKAAAGSRIARSSIKRRDIKIGGGKFVQVHGFEEKRYIATRNRNPDSGKRIATRSSIERTIVFDPNMEVGNLLPYLKDLLDQQPDVNLGDAVILAFKKSWNKAIRTPFSTREIPVKSVLPKTGLDKKFVDKKQAQQILDAVAEMKNGQYVAKSGPEGDAAFAEQGFVFGEEYMASLVRNNKLGKDTMQAKDKIVSYLASIVDPEYNRDPNDPQPKVARRSEVAALLTDGKNISPIFYPDTMPVDVSHSWVDIRDNKVVITFSGETPMFQDGVEGGQKWEIDGETFKGMVKRAAAEFEPSIFAGNDNPTVLADFAVSAETEASRVGGQDEVLLANALYFTMKSNDLSLFADKAGQGENETYTLSKAMQTWSDNDVYTFFTHPTRDFYSRILSGELRLSLDPEQNNAIIQVFSEIIREHLDPRMFFSNYKLVQNTNENGEIFYTRENWVGGDDNNYYLDMDHKNILKNIYRNSDKLLRLFNAVDDDLCPNGLSDNRQFGAKKNFIIAADGTSLVNLGNGLSVRMPVRYGRNNVLGETSQEMTPSNVASVAGQHVGARASDSGYSGGTINKGIKSNYISAGLDYEAYKNYLSEKQQSRGRQRYATKVTQPLGFDYAALFPSASRREIRANKRISTLLKETFSKKRVLVGSSLDKDGHRKKISSEDWQTSETKAALGRLNNLCERGKEWSYDMVEQLCKVATGSSWTDSVPLEQVDGKEVWAISDHALAETIDYIVDCLNSNECLPVKHWSDDTSDNRGRYNMALLPREMVQWVWNTMPHVREHYDNNIEKFITAMKEEQTKCEQAINSIIVNRDPRNKSRKIALTEMANALRLSYDEVSPVLSLPIAGDFFLPEINADLNSLAAALAGQEGWDEEMQQAFKSFVSMSDKKWEYLRRRLDELNIKSVKYTMQGTEQNVAYSRLDEARDITNILNSLAETSKVMAVLNPLITAGNLADRTFHQGGMRASLWLGHKLHVGPYVAKEEHIVPSEIRKASVEWDGAQELYISMREAEFSSQEMQFIGEILEKGNIEAAVKFVKDRKAELAAKHPNLSRFAEWGYKSASGGSLGIKWQMQTVIDRFVMFAEEAGQTFWFEPAQDMYREDGSPMTRLDAVLASQGGFANLMTFCLKPGSPSYTIFCQAMNSAKTGDMAQKNAVGLVLADICRRVPAGNFLMTTMVSRFPMYGLNVTGRLLNYILPMSSINRAFTETLAKTEYGKKIGVEETQIHTSMREAMMVDMCKLGAGGVALILFGLSGALQPPDDEKKWGDIDEWLVFGTRAGENWFIEDILGIALPLAAFWKACEMGQPRVDILTDGIANICYSNPVLRCGDIASWLMNPAESLITDYNEEVQQFQNAKGGPPSFGQYLQSNAYSFGVNWISQFFTPSIVKEAWRAMPSLEKSYKRYWETSDSGAITQEGKEGKTEYVTYDEAIKRKLALRNPVLAYLYTFASGNKSYLPEDMPDTVYYDDSQLESMNQWSVAGLDDANRSAKVIQLIGILQKYNDMNELASQGFHLDYETLQAVASQVWDNYHAADDWYNTLQAEGKLNYYYLGNGDYNEGMQIAAQLKQERDNVKQYWYNFYYQKLKDSPISAMMQTYNRYNTTYARDVYGHVYATGTLRAPFNILPIKNAPGTTENPEGTAGYENDFATVSAVTGKPMDQRALIPTDSGNIELPDFESFSADGNGKRYSKAYEAQYGNGATTSSLPGSSSTTSGTPGSTGSGSRSSGGSSYRSGGGGGGGYSRSYSSRPNIYAPTVDLPNANTSRIMNTDRNYGPNYDYLRPDFETKGSREAYRRSDF